MIIHCNNQDSINQFVIKLLQQIINGEISKLSDRDILMLNNVQSLILTLPDGLKLDTRIFEHMTNLISLKIVSNDLNDITALATLPKIKIIEIKNSLLEDISPLANLTTLEQLLLPNNKIIDISPLANLNQLKNLNLNKNKISNIEAIRFLKSIVELYLHKNQIIDITPLEYLTSLEILFIGKNKITNIDILPTLTSLKVIDIECSSDTPMLINLDPLMQINNLKSLGICNCDLKNYTYIFKNLNELKELSLIDCNIDNIEFLSNTCEIKYLRVRYNQITSLNGIENCKSLYQIDVSDNKINNIDALIHTPQVKLINLQNNLLTNENIKPLIFIKDIKSLDICDNKITNIDFISSVLIQEIYSNRNKIQNLPPLNQLKMKQMPKLISIESNNEIIPNTKENQESLLYILKNSEIFVMTPELIPLLQSTIKSNNQIKSRIVIPIESNDQNIIKQSLKNIANINTKANISIIYNGSQNNYILKIINNLNNKINTINIHFMKEGKLETTTTIEQKQFTFTESLVNEIILFFS